MFFCDVAWEILHREELHGFLNEVSFKNLSLLFFFPEGEDDPKSYQRVNLLQRYRVVSCLLSLQTKNDMIPDDVYSTCFL